MTLILRRTDAPFLMPLGSAGVCRVGLCAVVGAWGRGPIVRVVFLGGRWIQRCSLCGEKLIDSKGAAMVLNPDGTQPEFARWECGRLIRVSPGFPTRWEMLPESDKLPDDSCLELVE